MCDNPYDYCSPVVEGGYTDGAVYDGARPVGPPVFPEEPGEPAQAEPPATTEPDYFDLP